MVSNPFSNSWYGSTTATTAFGTLTDTYRYAPMQYVPVATMQQAVQPIIQPTEKQDSPNSLLLLLCEEEV